MLLYAQIVTWYITPLVKVDIVVLIFLFQVKDYTSKQVLKIPSFWAVLIAITMQEYILVVIGNYYKVCNKFHLGVKMFNTKTKFTS